MKKPEEYIRDSTIIDNPHGDRVFFKEDIIKMIKQAQIDAYNEALKDAVESAELNECDEHMQFSPHLDDNSILKLKK